MSHAHRASYLDEYNELGHNEGAREGLTRALGTSPIVAEKTRPQGCKHQDISERTARKANRARRSFAHHEGLSELTPSNDKLCSSYRLKPFVEHAPLIMTLERAMGE